MKCMILSAGRGERLRPMTDSVPKPLLTVGGAALIDHVIKRCHTAGIDDVVINLGYRGEQIAAHCGNGSQYGVHVRYAVEDVLLETGGGIVNALPLLGDGFFVVLNADVWCDYDLSCLRTQCVSAPWLAYLVMVDNPSYAPQGDFSLNAHGNIYPLGDNPLTFSGISVLHPHLFSGNWAGTFPLKDALVAAMERSMVAGEHYKGNWFDIGTPERLHAINCHLKAV